MRLSRSLICRGEGVAAEGQPHHREGIGPDLGDDGFIHRVGQAVAHTGGAVAHLGGGVVGVFFQAEAHRDLAALGPADGGDDIHRVNAGNGVLQRFGDLRLHHLGGCTGVAHADGHHGLVDLGIFAHRQAGKAHRADQSTSSDSTVASTGRRMEISASCMVLREAGQRAWEAPRRRLRQIDHAHGHAIALHLLLPPPSPRCRPPAALHAPPPCRHGVAPNCTATRCTTAPPALAGQHGIDIGLRPGARWLPRDHQRTRTLAHAHCDACKHARRSCNLSLAMLARTITERPLASICGSMARTSA